MIIEKTFKNNNEVEIIRQAIKNIAPAECVNFYHNYISSSADEGFEKRYIEYLWEKKCDFATYVLRKYLTPLSSAQLTELIIQNNIDESSYSYMNRMDNEDEDDFFLDKFSEKEMCDFIKDHMEKALEHLLKEEELTKKERKINSLKEHLESSKKTADYYNKAIEEYEKELAELELNQ